MKISQSLVIRFAQWAATNGGDADSAARLMAAARKRSTAIGGRISALSKNSPLEFSQGLTDNMAGDFTEREIQTLFSIGDNYEWIP